ncbi:MAG TPA: tetratricopeptide repeat protein [Vicinamibacterales bacterium]|nr:tetratricopeptide repeat protein [Vicinamibacterales bacterium]
MKIVVFVAVLGASAPVLATGQTRQAAPRRQATSPPAAPAPDRAAEAYAQFLQAHMFADGGNIDEAIAAYRRAMSLDPNSATIPAELAELYSGENRNTDAQAAAEQALKIDPANKQAHRVLGQLYAGLASNAQDSRAGRASQGEHVTQAIDHFEKALETPVKTTDIDVRALLSRLYIAADKFDKAIPLLTDIVKEAPTWRDGPNLLMEAYSGAGKNKEAVDFLEQSAPDNPQLYSTLAGFYGRERRWVDAAGAYELALKASPRSFDLRVNLASMLMNTGSRADLLRAREALREATGIRGTDERALTLLSQAERRAGDAAAAEAAARKLLAQNGKNPRGYFVLSEALEDQRHFQGVVDALAPAVASFRGTADGAFALGMLLPHLGFAYQELGQFEKAIQVFEDARKLAPNDPSMTTYLIRAQMAARNYSAAAEVARAARAQSPNDLRLASLESMALRRGGKVDQGVAAMEEFFRRQQDDPDTYVAMAQVYTDANRGAQAVKVLQEAQLKFPSETGIRFELGAVLDKQKKYAESEAVFRELISSDPQNAAALNYLGYMLAERGERLNESVDYIKRALALDPDNGSYLDSIGWAYFKDGKLDLAAEHLKRAADQLTTNSVVQDHYADVLFRLGRIDDAIAAWTKALSGDLDSVDRGDIDKKIRSARQKLPKK